MIGRGTLEPNILFVGEAPGAEEDRLNSPFVGHSGKELDRWISAAGIDPAGCRWTNVVRCCARDLSMKVCNPSHQHIDTCRDHLFWEIAKVKPKLIVCLGGSAVYGVTQKKDAVKRLRGYTHSFSFNPAFIESARNLGVNLSGIEIPVVVTYHPSYVLQLSSHSPQYVEQTRATIVGDLIYARKKAWSEESISGKNYRILNSAQEVNAFTDWLLEQHKSGAVPMVGMDTETGTPINDDRGGFKMFDPRGCIVTIQIAYGQGQAVLIPVDHPESNLRDPLSMSLLRDCMDKILNTVPSAWQNGKFDFKWFYAKFGIKIGKFAFDTMLAHQTRFMGTEPNDLYYLAAKYLGMQGYGDALDTAFRSLPKGHKSFRNISLQTMVDYACGDADVTLRLVPILTKELEKMNLLDTYKLTVLDCMEPISMMETHGLKLDMDIFGWLQGYYPKVLQSMFDPIRLSPWYPEWLRSRGCPSELVQDVIERKVHTKMSARWELNPGSPEQKARFIYQFMKMPDPGGPKGKKTNLPSTNQKIIELLIEHCMTNKWEMHHDILTCFQKYGRAAKLHSAYVKNLMNLVEQQEGRVPNPLFDPFIPNDVKGYYFVHPHYNIEGTRTGRVSASEPAIHNIPHAKEIKRLFISRWRDLGGLHLGADYSQMEIRILAQAANDSVLMAAIASGRDIHKEVGSKILGIPPEKITPHIRRLVKTINFGILYGAGPDKISFMAKCTKEEAESFMAQYLGTFKGVADWKKDQERFSDKNQYIRTMFGRIRPTPIYRNESMKEKSRRHRVCINTPIQSDASTVTQTSIARAYRRINELGMNSKVILFKHDEIAFDCYPGEFFAMRDLLYDEMVNEPKKHFSWLQVPLVADFEAGYSWGNLCEIKKKSDHEFTSEGKGPDCEALFHQLRLSGFKLHEKSDYVVNNDGDIVFNVEVENPYDPIKCIQERS
jgi:uracil-DNA glycosylase family 4